MNKLETLSMDQLARVGGGDGAGGMDIGGMLNMVGGMADKMGAGGKGAQIAGMLGPMIQQFAGAAGGGGGQQQG
jgi:hypothetical protein